MNVRDKWVLGALLPALALGQTACTDAVAPEAVDAGGPLFAKGGGGGPRGGGGGEPSAGDKITTLADAPGDRVFSDGQGGYATIKKQQEVLSEITSDGRHWLDVTPRRGEPVALRLVPAGGSRRAHREPGLGRIDERRSGGARAPRERGVVRSLRLGRVSPQRDESPGALTLLSTAAAAFPSA